MFVWKNQHFSTNHNIVHEKRASSWSDKNISSKQATNIWNIMRFLKRHIKGITPHEKKIKNAGKKVPLQLNIDPDCFTQRNKIIKKNSLVQILESEPSVCCSVLLLCVAAVYLYSELVLKVARIHHTRFPAAKVTFCHLE